MRKPAKHTQTRETELVVYSKKPRLDFKKTTAWTETHSSLRKEAFCRVKKRKLLFLNVLHFSLQKTKN